MQVLRLNLLRGTVTWLMLARSGFDNYDYHVNIVLVKGSNLRKKITIISEPYFAYFVTFSWIIYQEHFISK